MLQRLESMCNSILTGLTMLYVMAIFSVLGGRTRLVLAGLLVVGITLTHFWHPLGPDWNRLSDVLFWLIATGAGLAALAPVVFLLGKAPNPNLMAPTQDRSLSPLLRLPVIVAAFALVAWISYRCHPALWR